MELMVDVNLLQITSVVLVGLFNAVFTLLRTRSKGAIIVFPQPYILIFERGNKITVKGIIHNAGDKNTMVKLLNPITRIPSKKDRKGSMIIAINLENQKEFRDHFPIAKNQFYEVQATFERQESREQSFFFSYKFVNETGKWVDETQEIIISR
jgi:hypothetical protein